jgi:dTDP-4-amino-4,6-dideoxygalactose transaminase
MPVAFFDLTRQNQSLQKELDAKIAEVVASGKYILGDYVSALEKEAAAYCGVKHAIGVASGTDALHLALRACGLRPGDEVITSPFTFVATVEAIAYCGAIPVFVDIEPGSFNLDPAKIEAKITRRTKAILPVHLYGQACAMDKIMPLAKKHSLFVVEDCAQAIGAAFNKQKVGSFGDAGCFSFFPTKNLGCFGDGGLVTTNSDQVAEQLKVLRGHGSRVTYHYDIVGYNSRLDALQAAILSVKFPHLDDFSFKRRKNAAFYARRLSTVPGLTLPTETPGAFHVYNQYTIRAKHRDQIFSFLKARGVSSMVYYPLSLHLQKAFSWLGSGLGDLPESEAAQDEVLSLPIFPELDLVCSAIEQFVAP